MMGEFGRTPRFNDAGGRDHWPHCFSVVMAGGGIRGGQVHGASDRIAAYPAADPVTPDDLIATLYHCLGVDPTATDPRPAGPPLPARRRRATPLLALKEQARAQLEREGLADESNP